MKQCSPSCLASSFLLGLLALASACSSAEEIPVIELPESGKNDGFIDVDPASCPGGSPRLVNGSRAAWTLIHYAAADNNLEDVLIEDINEMERGHGGSANVNVLVQIDKYSEDGVWRYEIGPDSDPDVINSKLVGQSDEEPDSGDWRTLASYGRWAATCYPAENYMVVVGGHGGGWSQSEEPGRSASSLQRRAQKRRALEHGESLRLIAPDDTDGSEIYVDQLATALNAIRAKTRQPGDPERLNRLVAYGSDACLMETIEVAYDLRNAVRYVVGSEENEPGQGWPYSTILRSLTSRPWYYSDNPTKLMDEVVDAFGRSYGAGGVANNDDMVTLAAVDTSALQRAKNRLGTVGTLLTELIEVDDALLPQIVDARGAVNTFGGGYADLGSFLLELRGNLTAAGLVPAVGETWTGDERWRELRDAIDELDQEIWPELVPSFRQSEAYASATGLSIFFPADECYSGGLDVESYGRGAFAKDTGWDVFLQTFLDAGAVDTTDPSAYEEAIGNGPLTAALAGQSQVLEADCDLYGDDLYIDAWYGCYDSSCQPFPLFGVGLNLKIGTDKLTVTGYSGSYEDDNGFWYDDADGVSINVTDAKVTPGVTYSGSVALELKDDNASLVPVTLTFACEDFRVNQCSGDDWF